MSAAMESATRADTNTRSSTSFQPPTFELSPTLQTARSQFAHDEPVSATDFTRTILSLYDHAREYAGGRAAKLSLEETRTRHPIQVWIDEVQTLFNPVRIQELSKSNRPPVLHGRLAIIGLCLLEPRLRRQFKRDDVLTMLIDELDEPLDDILSERGHNLFEPFDSVPNHPDNPVATITEDRLGRAAFARYLAQRVFALPELNSEAYAIHLYGPWGSGKSTLLNFLCSELEQGNWLVVEFNAWQNQQIRPPWWSLYERAFQKCKTCLRPWQRLSESWWRLTTGRVQYLIALTALAWLLVLVMSWSAAAQSSEAMKLDTMATTADNLGKIVAFGLTIWTIIQATSHSLLFGSAKAARNYTDLTSDPMSDVASHFSSLIQRVNTRGKRVAIFIDDLDRCQSSYVIELLEGIQTVFRKAPVLFVIAADRHWLNACYEETYDKLKSLVHEPGKPLGTLFLEKAFQFSTSVPGIPLPLREAYWQDLIQVRAARNNGDREEAQQKATEVMAHTSSEGAVMEAVRDSRGHSFAEQRAIREQAVIRLAAPEIVERTEHTLKPFASLLAPNPRAMKRLVNTYSVNRALATLSHVDIELDQLALWTILSLRWPRLADYLEENPVTVEKIGQQNLADVPKEWRVLFNDEEVINVVCGGGMAARLEVATIRECVLLRG